MTGAAHRWRSRQPSQVFYPAHRRRLGRRAADKGPSTISAGRNLKGCNLQSASPAPAARGSSSSAALLMRPHRIRDARPAPSPRERWPHSTGRLASPAIRPRLRRRAGAGSSGHCALHLKLAASEMVAIPATVAAGHKSLA